MIISIGIDLVEKNRIKKILLANKSSFIYKILIGNEICDYVKSKKKIEFLSKIFAVKESISKSLGIGLREGIKFKNIKFCKTNLNKPYLIFKKYKTYVSISHDRNLTIAFVVLLKNK